VRRRLLVALGGLLLVLVPGSLGRASPDGPARVEVVVTLASPPLAYARRAGPRLSVDSAATARRLRQIETGQRAAERRIRAAIPEATVRWRYSITLDGLAVVLPRRDLPRLAAVPGVEDVWPNAQFRLRLDRSPGLIGAPQLWGPNLATAGQGMKIGIIDDGIDEKHPFFDPTGFRYPPGFPKGQTSATTPKVIVARAFPPPAGAATPRSKYDSKPFDPDRSFHGTHVAGIAAGDSGTQADVRGRALTLSGVAPRAYLGNYKAIGVASSPDELVDNAAELAAAIEAAVKDGMDVINLSLGESEIEPSRNIVVKAIDGAAAAGVVPVISAGNDFDAFGAGSVGSPASAAGAIAVAASTKTGEIADFSSGGPTPVSLELKPDVTAPGVAIASSFPRSQGLWSPLSGTSMAAPHVSGGVALLRQRHPSWTVDQIKSALVQTGSPVFTDTSHREEAPTLREGGGLLTLPRADNPLLFAAPVSASFGVLSTGQTVTRPIALTDAGGGAGSWSVAVTPQSSSPDVTVTAPTTVTVPGRLDISASTAGTAGGADLTGFVTLSRGGDVRRIPYWVTVSPHALASEPHGTLSRNGVYRGDTRGKPSVVDTYRYPRGNTRLSGPEQVFRVTMTKQVANFGVVLLSGQSSVEPRIVFAGDESHVAGYAGLPLAVNPYTDRYYQAVPVAASIRPRPGAYDVVFDTKATAGPFRFRFWIDDTSPPKLRLLATRLRVGSTLLVSATDAGAGVDPQSIRATVDGVSRQIRFSRGRVRVSLDGVGKGRHSLEVRVADFQELKNNENVPLVLPNTRILKARFVVR
jgi:subtilisin family serine protease